MPMQLNKSEESNFKSKWSRVVTIIQREEGQALGKSCTGAILIEFAIAIPVLILLVYYLHDIPRLKHLNSRMKFCAHCMANILQNVSQDREDKKITLSYLRNTVAAAYLSIFPGKTIYTTSKSHAPFGYVLSGQIYCVKGLDNGNVSVMWCYRWHAADNSPSPSTITIQTYRDPRSLVNTGTNVSPPSIYPGLSIQSGQIKILVEVAFHYYPSSVGTKYYFTDGRSCASVPAKTALGFWVLSPTSKGSAVFFNTVVIFTPKPGLFDETEPI
jgi:Flp pilus assembly protein TadG